MHSFYKMSCIQLISTMTCFHIHAKAYIGQMLIVLFRKKNELKATTNAVAQG